MQKLMYKGLLQDNQILGNIGLTKGAKIMLVGSTLNDVLAVSYVSKQVSWNDMYKSCINSLFKDVAESDKATTKEPLSKQKIHRKVLDKGVPEDVMPGIKNLNVNITFLPPLPTVIKF